MRRKIILNIIIIFSSMTFPYKIFITPSQELFYFIKEKSFLSENIKFVSLSISQPFIDILDSRKTEGFIENDLKGNLNYILPDRNYEGYLHEKFIIFNNKSVLFGTGNFTSGSIFEDINLFIYSEDIKIVNLFLKEFKNFASGKFGKKKEIINEEIFTKEFGKIKIVTGPSENIYNTVKDFITNTNEFLNIYTFSFTDSRIAYLIEKLSTRKNIKIKIYADDWNLENINILRYLKGVEVKFIKDNKKNMHLKILINEKGVLIGSYNLTYRAREKNDEYLFIVFNNKFKEEILEKIEKSLQKY
ncbi:hypothetical protein Marpi_0557 [Marinitoga piezophila KA3]|uniref:phospholipase D n=1 Tax=Marinitoga piezophila (strain DSM 14283 / JCM 11233 / KA3) TaxID=443254 RepID=H2J5L2_MARPK|nr:MULTISPECIES: phospholipase D-like domain-containing protein [Marinitoga]AEX84998.1 hypothetical protein Marpi_0557 [Marinitoga piezophila KA3]APT75502.1 hypothetical protein LN42_03165 [Marinitoga sp. 1137]